MKKKTKDPFAKHLRVLRRAIRAQHDWRGGGPPDDYPEWDAQKRNALLALRQMHTAAVLGEQIARESARALLAAPR